MSLYDWCGVPNMTSEEKTQWCLTACAYAAPSLMDSIPDCTYNGVNAYELLTDLEAGCDAVSTEDSSSDGSDDLGGEYGGSGLFGSGSGGECTSDQISELLSVMEDTLTGSGCADMQSELADASTAEVCASPCWTSIEEHFDDFPDCDYEGVNLHSQFQQAMDQCASFTGNGAARGSSVSGVAAAGVAAASTALVLYAL